jgi:hypothetical protein
MHQIPSKPKADELWEWVRPGIYYLKTFILEKEIEIGGYFISILQVIFDVFSSKNRLLMVNVR